MYEYILQHILWFWAWRELNFINTSDSKNEEKEEWSDLRHRYCRLNNVVSKFICKKRGNTWIAEQLQNDSTGFDFISLSQAPLNDITAILSSGKSHMTPAKLDEKRSSDAWDFHTQQMLNYVVAGYSESNNKEEYLVSQKKVSL